MSIQEQIIEYCKMPQQRYCEIVFQMGIEYLEYETSGDEFYVSEIARSKEFWLWWNKIVEERNILFLKEFNYSYLSTHELCYIWESLLNVKSLDVYPSEQNWSDRYYELIKPINKHKIR